MDLTRPFEETPTTTYQYPSSDWIYRYRNFLEALAIELCQWIGSFWAFSIQNKAENGISTKGEIEVMHIIGRVQIRSLLIPFGWYTKKKNVYKNWLWDNKKKAPIDGQESNEQQKNTM